MPHSLSYAKRLLRELPDDLTVLLERKKYWDTTFLGLYLDHCDAVLFDRPLDGLELATAGSAATGTRCPSSRRLSPWRGRTATPRRSPAAPSTAPSTTWPPP